MKTLPIITKHAQARFRDRYNFQQHSHHSLDKTNPILERFLLQSKPTGRPLSMTTFNYLRHRIIDGPTWYYKTRNWIFVIGNAKQKGKKILITTYYI